jgi:hypothetical protein
LIVCDLVVSGLHSGLTFSPGIHGQQMAKNQFLLAFSDGSNLPEPYSFEIFGKSFFYQNLVEQGKVQLLLKKPFHFSEKIVQKSGISSGFLKYFFLQS